MLLSVLAVVCVLTSVCDAHATRLKDLATFSGVRSNQLVGYGLVVGLSGTGDGTSSPFTIRSMANMLEKMGVQVDAGALKPKNVASVMVTANMPVTSRPGSRIDVAVASIGDSKSLFGGTLLMTPLKGIDGQVYGIAQGALTLGGFSAQGEASIATKNVVTAARIPNGATIERPVPFEFNDQRKLTLNLSTDDFGTTMRIVRSMNGALGGNYATARDVSTVDLRVPDRYVGNMVPLIASLENLEISVDGKARVVVDERTGTIVLGGNVRMEKVAVAHGNLQVVVAETMDVSQPGALSGGQTVASPNTDIQVEEQNNRLMLMEGATLQEMVDGLNAIGATPRDLISILRALKVSGALHAELEVI